MTAIRWASPADVDFETAYRILALRTDVFVVEQQCPYRELDGRDLEADCLWGWTGGERPTAFLRVLRDTDGFWRIGRVVTDPDARGQGLAADLMAEALVRSGRPLCLDAQAHLEDWYARFGFTRVSDNFLDDGIPHVRMERHG